MRKNNNLAPEGVEVSEEAELMVGTSEVGKKRDYFLPVSILIAGVLIAGSVVYMVLNKNTGATPGVNNLPAVGANAGGGAGAGGTTNGGNIPQLGNRDVILGNPNAPVTFIEYADYQCPFCTKFFSETQPLLVTNYVQTGKMKMVFRNFPFLGPNRLPPRPPPNARRINPSFGLITTRCTEPRHLIAVEKTAVI